MMFNKKSQLLGVCKKSLPLAIALALTACGGSSSETDQSVGALKIGTHPVFDPLAGSLPLNTDLLFAAAASSDGTANVGVPTNPAEAAINALDGFSTSAYFDIAFAGGSIDADTVVACQLAMLGTGACAQANVFVLALDTGGNDALDPANVVGVDTPSLPAFEASVVSLDGGTDNTLRIAPLEPLKAKTKYLVFVTNGLKDTSGQPITPSGSYHVLGENVPDLTPALQPVRGAVQGWESIAAAFLNSASGGAISLEQARDSVAVSYTFTTTDPIAPLVAMAAPRAALAEQGVPDANLDQLAPLLSTPKARDLNVAPQTGLDIAVLTGTNCESPQLGQLPCGVGSLFTGQITLPYYQSAASGEVDFDPSFLAQNWRPDTDLAGFLGKTVPEDIDGTLNVTYRYPFAKQQGAESVPLQVTLPNPDHRPQGPETPSCKDLTAIESETNPYFGGYPVALYIHGITSDRASVVALAHTLASQCVATVAVDLPVHGIAANSPFVNALNVEKVLIPEGEGAGTPLYPALYGDSAPRERHFNVAQNSALQPAEMDFETPSNLDRSGAWFVNLANLPNTRDNLRQAVMDLLNVNASLGQIAGLNLGEDHPSPLFDTDKLFVVGHSLGGIVGSVFTAVNQLAVVRDGENSELNPVKGLVVSAGGSQLTQILNHSEAFGPVIKAGLAANGVEEGTTNYERFLYVAQSTVDSGDPVNFAGIAGSLGVPILVQMVESDQVVPNGVAGVPLTGTQPLACLLFDGALLPECPSSDNFKVIGDGAAHSSLLTPSRADASDMIELQTQVVQFILGG